MLSNTYDGRLQLFVKVTKEPSQIGGWHLVGIWRTWCEAQDFIKAHKIQSVDDRSIEHANREGLRALKERYSFIAEALSRNSKKQEHHSQQKLLDAQEGKPRQNGKGKSESGKAAARHNGATNGSSMHNGSLNGTKESVENLDEAFSSLTDQSIQLKNPLNRSGFQAKPLQDVRIKVKNVRQQLQEEAVCVVDSAQTR